MHDARTHVVKATALLYACTQLAITASHHEYNSPKGRSQKHHDHIYIYTYIYMLPFMP